MVDLGLDSGGFTSGFKSGFGLMQNYYSNQRQQERQDELMDMKREAFDQKQELNARKMKNNKAKQLFSKALAGMEPSKEEKKWAKTALGVDMNDFRKGRYAKVKTAFNQFSDLLSQDKKEKAMKFANRPGVKDALSQALKPEIQKVIGKNKEIKNEQGDVIEGKIISAEIGRITPIKGGRIGIDLDVKMKNNQGTSYTYRAPVTYNRGTNDNDSVAAISAGKILDRMKGISILEDLRENSPMSQEEVLGLMGGKYNKDKLRSALGAYSPEYQTQLMERQRDKEDRLFEIKKMLLEDRLNGEDATVKINGQEVKWDTLTSEGKNAYLNKWVPELGLGNDKTEGFDTDQIKVSLQEIDRALRRDLDLLKKQQSGIFAGANIQGLNIDEIDKSPYLIQNIQKAADQGNSIASEVLQLINNRRSLISKLPGMNWSSTGSSGKKGWEPYKPRDNNTQTGEDPKTSSLGLGPGNYSDPNSIQFLLEEQQKSRNKQYDIGKKGGAVNTFLNNPEKFNADDFINYSNQTGKGLSTRKKAAKNMNEALSESSLTVPKKIGEQIIKQAIQQGAALSDRVFIDPIEATGNSVESLLHDFKEWSQSRYDTNKFQKSNTDKTLDEEVEAYTDEHPELAKEIGKNAQKGESTSKQKITNEIESRPGFKNGVIKNIGQQLNIKTLEELVTEWNNISLDKKQFIAKKAIKEVTGKPESQYNSTITEYFIDLLNQVNSAPR